MTPLKNKLQPYVISIISCIFLLSCNHTEKRNGQTTETETKRIDVSEPFTTNGNETSANDALLAKWDNAHNTKNMEILKEMYATNVFYYTKEKTRDEVIKVKQDVLQKSTDYQQKSIFVEDYIFNDRTEIYFDKTFSSNGKSSTVRSVLILTRIDDAFKISEETDMPSKKYVKKLEKQVSEDADFNGDGKKEYAEIHKPVIIVEEMSCENGDCMTEIQFSDKTIKNIEVKNCIGGMLEPEGDLDGDGADEIGIVDDWFTSRWGRYIVFTYKNNDWQVLASLSVDRFAVMEDQTLRASLVKKISDHKIEVSNYIWSEEKEDMAIKKSVITIP